jgi:hypothetical protein
MTIEQFDSVLSSGHKQDAVELPFDPAVRWNSKPVSVGPGRRGHRVTGTLNGIAFESCVLTRMKHHYVVIEAPLRLRAGIEIGDPVRMVLRLADPK